MRRVLPAAGLAVLAALAGCDDEPSARSTDYSVGPDDQYVALGDSYTAAPRTGPNADTSGCSNTTVNYPHRIADATGVELQDTSCNGASTSHLTVPKPATERGPQLDAVDEDTDLVTMRLGANDYNIIFRMFACAQRFGPELPGTPCADFDARGGENSLDNRLVDVRANLEGAVDAIEERAPDARIILIGYPHLAPAEGTCDELPLPAGDYAYARRIIDGLNDALEAVAGENGLTYVDMEGPGAGHDICGDEPWMAGPGLPVVGATPWHPYAAESQAVAELVLAELEDD